MLHRHHPNLRLVRRRLTLHLTLDSGNAACVFELPAVEEWQPVGNDGREVVALVAVRFSDVVMTYTGSL